MANYEVRITNGNIRNNPAFGPESSTGRQSSFVIRQLTVLILCVLPLLSCGRYQAGRDRVQAQFFAEIVKRENSRWIGEDGFFESSLLVNPDPEVRQWSAVALGRIGSPRALPLLYRAVRTGDTAVRAASAFAIGVIEDREFLERRYLDLDPEAATELHRLLGDPSLTVQMRAVEALGKIGSHGDAVEIVGRLEGFSYSGLQAERAYLGCAITALARLEDPVALPVLERLAAASDPEIRWRALDALARLRTKTAGPLFIRNLDNPNAEVRSYAARGLAVIEDPGAVSLLAPLLPPRHGPTRSPIPLSVRFQALQALGEIKNPAAIPFIKTALEGDPIDEAHPDQQNFAIEAAAAIGEIGASEGESLLLPLLRFPGPLADNAVIALAKMLKANPEHFFLLADSSLFASPAALPAWIQAMVELGGPDAGDELSRILLRTADKATASEASVLPMVLTAMAKTQVPGWQDILVPFFGSHDAAILRAAVEAYQPKSAAKEPWAPIIQAFTACSASGDIEAKIEILSHLKPWISEAQVQQMLKSSLKDPERSVRLTSAALLRRAGVTGIAVDPPPENRSAADAFCYALAAFRKNSTIARLETNRGDMEIELFREDAPLTVADFVLMANHGAYDGLQFTQVVPSQAIGAMIPRIQAGLGRATGDEINMRPFERGSFGMARAGRNSETGRLLITLASQPYLDGTLTCFGRVISGMQIADRIVPGDRIKRIVIKETISTLDFRRY